MMLLQVMREYPCLGDFRNLSISEIEVLYDGLRHELMQSRKKASK